MRDTQLSGTKDEWVPDTMNADIRGGGGGAKRSVNNPTSELFEGFWDVGSEIDGPAPPPPADIATL